MVDMMVHNKALQQMMMAALPPAMRRPEMLQSLFSNPATRSQIVDMIAKQVSGPHSSMLWLNCLAHHAPSKPLPPRTTTPYLTHTISTSYTMHLNSAAPTKHPDSAMLRVHAYQRGLPSPSLPPPARIPISAHLPP
jgi:hypothetical protein